MLPLKKKNNSSFKDALNKCETLEQFLNTCGDYYDLKNCKLNAIQLSALVGGIDKLITVSGAKPKKNFTNGI